MAGSTLKKIRLETEDGYFVVTGLIPPFVTPPAVVTWGVRTFQKATTGAGPEIYRECFCVAVVETE